MILPKGTKIKTTVMIDGDFPMGTFGIVDDYLVMEELYEIDLLIENHEGASSSSRYVTADQIVILDDIDEFEYVTKLNKLAGGYDEN